MLTKEEIKFIRNAAKLIETRKSYYTCHAIQTVQGEALCFDSDLKCKYAEFYEKNVTESNWDVDLPCDVEHCTEETQLQRELMLELFAHLKGVL